MNRIKTSTRTLHWIAHFARVAGFVVFSQIIELVRDRARLAITLLALYFHHRSLGTDAVVLGALSQQAFQATTAQQA